MLRKSLFLSLNLFFAVCSMFAQETESATSSKLTAISLPANAQRIHPARIPDEITKTLEKLVSASGGKLRQDETEVLVWTGDEYQKVGKSTTIYRLTDTLKMAGWKYEVSGEEDGITVFSLVKSGANRRAIIGVYGESDGILVFAWAEVLSNSSTVNLPQNIENTQVTLSDKNEIVGIWRKGGMSMLQDRNTVTGATTAANGMNLKFVFHPNGRFEFVGYLQSTMYGCKTDLFNDKQGKYEISGTKITLIPSKNYWKNTYSCSPKSNKERNYTLENETYDLKFKTDEYGKFNVCLVNAKGETCYRKEKE
jgi:hypothetical protein